MGGVRCSSSHSNPATQYHAECRNNSCVPISGAGTDQCSTNADCTTIAQINAVVTLVPTSGTLNAVDLDSMFSENITVSLNNVAGSVDPNSIRISIAPSLDFTETAGFSNGSFDGFVFITPNGFLSAGTTYSVTTSFNAIINNATYAIINYSAFTTVSSAGTNTVSPGRSFILGITTISQPQGLGPLLSGNIPPLAITTITTTTSLSNPDAGSMIFYGGQAVYSSSPTDIYANSFSMPLLASWDGSYAKASGSAVINVYGIIIPMQTFDLSGTLNAFGGIDNGTLYAVVHCTDASCSNLGSVAGPLIAQFIDVNGNMIILGTFIGIPNTVPSTAWLTGSDTTGTTLLNGIGSGISTATLEITTTTSPLTTTATLPFLILATTDSNNMLSLAGWGPGGPALPQASPVTLTYALTTLTGTSFSTVAATAYTAYYLFGLEPVLSTQFTP